MKTSSAPLSSSWLFELLEFPDSVCDGHGEGGGEFGFSVVDVTDGSDVDMRFSAFVFSTGGAYGEGAATMGRGGGGGWRLGVEEDSETEGLPYNGVVDCAVK
ncbi:hypothetical protein L6452_06762 [Arctium lappa]|uniref:Uncharacterized protein n=1 Tax=Arctium lappa TaxID=4217 RepID=A0ACB9EKS6_ARCLA|nr:hypothetical protein L6452_06762 [Arctium lappa]